MFSWHIIRMRFVGIFLILLAAACYAEPSIVDYRFIIDGNTTNSSVVYISPLSSPGVKDGVHFNITANESVNWSLSIILDGSVSMGPLKRGNKNSLQKPDDCFYWNGTSGSCTGNNLLEGNYTVDVTFIYLDSLNNSVSITDASRNIIIDNTPPSVLFQSPQNFINSKIVNLNFTASDSSGISGCSIEWMNETGVTLNKTLANCSSENIGAKDGNHTVRIRSIDLAGNTGTRALSFIVDTIAPYVSLSSPENSTYNSSYIYLNYTAFDANQITCSIEFDGLNTTLQDCNNHTISSGSKGSHLLRLWVNDTAGNVNVSTSSFTNIYLSQEIEIASPLNTTYNTTNISLSYRISAGDCFYSLNNGSNTQLPNCTSAPIQASEGLNFLQLFSNNSGNINSSNVSFSVDTIAPELSIQSPTSTTYNSTSVSLAYTTSGISCYYVLNGVTHSLANCANIPIQAATGSNSLVLYSKDDMNNTNSASVSFTVSLPVQTPPPTTPTNTQNNQQTTPPKNITTKQANSTNQSIVNNTIGPVTPPVEKENSTLQNNTASNQSSIFGITGAIFANPLPIALAALALIVIIILAAAWKLAKRPKSKDGVVTIK